MGGQHKGEPACSVDLKLGRLEGSSSGTMNRAPLPQGSSSKRARAPGGAGQQTATCAVDGCKADLSGCREYHRRHKVCELHSKTPVVTVGGLHQRFCQQCSRFHLLVEFDDGKRSCRKRLDGHNRRRRKPQPEPASLGSLFPIYQGPRFSSYPHMMPPATTQPPWVSVLKDGHPQPFQLVERQRHIPTSPFHIYKEGKGTLPYVDDQNPMVHSGNAVLNSELLSLRNNLPSTKGIGQEEYTREATKVLNSDCALSLLSSPTQTPPTNLSNMVSSSHLPFGQPVAQSMDHLGELGRYSRTVATDGISPIGLSCMEADEKLESSVMDCVSNDSINLCYHTYLSYGR